MGKELWKNRVFKILSLSMLLVFLCGISAAAAGTKTVKMEKDREGYLIYEGIWDDSSPTVYHRFTVKKPSVVLVMGASVDIYDHKYEMNVELCNSKKKSLEQYKGGSYVCIGDSVEDSYYALYTLQKGTYYIKTSGEQLYALLAYVSNKLGELTITDKGGASKAKAQKLNAAKTAIGIIAAGEEKKKADWYKFKVTRSQILNFNIGVIGSSGARFTLYGPGYRKGKKIGELWNGAQNLLTFGTNSWNNNVGNMKVTPGTYYIKIDRSSSYRNKALWAIYAIQWK